MRVNARRTYDLRSERASKARRTYERRDGPLAGPQLRSGLPESTSGGPLLCDHCAASRQRCVDYRAASRRRQTTAPSRPALSPEEEIWCG